MGEEHSKAGMVTVWTVERCYDYEGSSLERVFGTEAEADAYVAEAKRGGTCATFHVCSWEVQVPS